MEERFLVTGGAGFIGSHIVEALVERGNRVRILDNFSTGKEENLGNITQQHNNPIEIIKGDLRNEDVVKEAIEGIDYVFHLAALPSVSRSVEDPVGCSEINIIGTLNVLNASKNSNVKRVVYSSSSSAYGDSPELPKKETMEANPLSPYAVSKLAGETYCRVFTNIYGLETVSLRYFNVFGPRQDPDSEYAAVIPKFIKMMIKHSQPTIFGDGEQTRDFTYVRNVVDANLRAMETKGVEGEVFNIACGEKITINQLIKELGMILDNHVKPLYFEARKGDIKDSLADVSKAKEVLGYDPEIRLKEGLESTIRYFSKKG
jgi:nucleoside-diphosphate-sugar epimerase